MSSWIDRTKKQLGGFAGIAATAALVLTSAAACSDDANGQTGLNPEGPPMIRQVFVLERVTNPDMSIAVRSGMAFGDHPDFTAEEDDRMVAEAIASTNIPIRVVFDELLVGNNLEEIACTDGTFARVPLDADPDDIRDCSPANLELGNCTAVCAANGGIKDEDEDGAPDADGGRRMIELSPGVLAAQLTCDGTNIPLDPVASFYSPAGNQQITAGPLGINSLGPALVLVPTSGMRTGASCTVTFDASVVDKDNNQVCAPANGDINQACTPGDTSLVAWGTEILKLNQSDPGPNATSVPVVTAGGPDKEFTLLFNADIAMESIAGAFQLIENPGAGEVDRTADITAALNENDPSNVTLTIAGGLAGDSDYELRLTTGLTDTFGGALPQMSTLSFTTGAAPTVDAAVDAT